MNFLPRKFLASEKSWYGTLAPSPTGPPSRPTRGELTSEVADQAPLQRFRSAWPGLAWLGLAWLGLGLALRIWLDFGLILVGCGLAWVGFG